VTNLTHIVLTVAVALVAGSVVALISHIRKAIDSRLAASALSLLTSHAGTLVLAAMDEVRTLKAKPGAWTAADASRVKGRVLDELRALGSRDIEVLATLQGLSESSVTTLLDKLVEEQVEVLRAAGKPSSTVNVLVPPAEPAEAEAPAAP
jgi:hypothetical protein